MALSTPSRREMDKTYNPQDVEKRLYDYWEALGYFQPNTASGGDPFCIIMPPPNVTGELHPGHALVATLSDILVRWHRMRGEPTLWLPGEDHASIAAQWVMEQELAKEGKTRQQLGREGFLERMWDWMDKYRHIIMDQHKMLGASCDWSRERFTMDPGPTRAVVSTFVDYFNRALIYRGYRIINWCPRCGTALSDLEVDHEEGQGALYYVRYPLEPAPGQPDFIPVATTRPETILGDTAIAVNAEDARYQSYIGRMAIVPGVGRRIPVIADGAVEAGFGTGALKITPAHDPVDFEVGQRHGLPLVVAMHLDAVMNQEAGPYAGLTREQCRQAILRDLEAAGQVERIDTSYVHGVGHCYRCKTIVEPIVSEQWFLNVQEMAGKAIEAVESGRITIVPERFNKVYYHWMENIRDWCISRQLWWGHRIPAWYCGDCDGEAVQLYFDEPLAGNPSGSYAALRKAGLSQEAIVNQPGRMAIGMSAQPMVSADPPTACPRCAGHDLVQDPDVLDTWFSSGLWPHSTLGWPEQTTDLRTFYPTSVMVTGYDILFFWVARMVMMGVENTDEAPFRTVYLHGLIRDEQGEKMSKSKGNVISPADTIASYGTDALRFTLATGSTPGNDMKLSNQRLEASRNFANKLWNAARFVLSNLPDGEQLPLTDALRADRPTEDRWIVSRLHRVIEAAGELLSNFQLGEAGRQLHDFLWNEYCDWYIETAKIRLRNGDASPLPVLVHVLEQSLRLLHPYMPYVTEEIWGSLQTAIRWEEAAPGALIVAPYPEADTARFDAAAEAEMEITIEVVRAIRNARAERSVPPARLIQAQIVAATARAAALQRQQNAIKVLARLESMELLPDNAPRPDKAVPLVLGSCEVYLPLLGMIDTGAEHERLMKELTQEQAEQARAEAKLSNASFVQKAPADVVAKERERLDGARERAERLQARLAELTV